MKLQACILIALAIVGVYADEPEKLVNGIPTFIEQYPHAVSIRVQGSHFCGGSIISSRHILTAAHCVQPLVSNPNLRQNLAVVTGTTYLSSGGQFHTVSRMWYHEYYNPYTPGRDAGFDIGILELSAPISFNAKQQSIRLPTSDVLRGESVSIVAWGATGFRQRTHDDLRKLNAAIMLQNECQARHGNFMEVHPNEFCTLISYGTGACNGDSGSGVVRNSDRTIIGLVSGGRPCAQGYPDVFTDVAKFLPWINSKIGY